MSKPNEPCPDCGEVHDPEFHELMTVETRVLDALGTTLNGTARRKAGDA